MNYINPSAKLFRHIDRIQEVRQGKSPAPVNVEIDLSNRCSLGCAGCHFAHTHSRGPLANSPKPAGAMGTGDLMDLRLAKRILSQLEYAGVRSVTWTGGGEPTLHPNFSEIVEYCKIPQGIYTNGVHIQDKSVVLKERMTWVYISLDYRDQEKYKRHKLNDAFDKVYRGVENLVRTSGKATVGLGFLLWRENWQDTAKMVHLGQELGVDYVQFRPMIYYDINHQNQVSEDTTWMTELISTLEYYSGMPGVIVDIDRFRDYQRWQGHPYTACWWSKLQTVITPDGKMWTCVNRRGMIGDELGDLNQDAFMDIWEKHNLKIVDENCRVLCRGHIPNVTLTEIMQPPTGHDLFV